MSVDGCSEDLPMYVDQMSLTSGLGDRWPKSALASMNLTQTNLSGRAGAELRATRINVRRPVPMIGEACRGSMISLHVGSRTILTAGTPNRALSGSQTNEGPKPLLRAQSYRGNHLADYRLILALGSALMLRRKLGTSLGLFDPGATKRQ